MFDQESIQTDIVIAFDTAAGLDTYDAARPVMRELVEERMSSLRNSLGATYGVSVTQSARRDRGSS